METTITMTPREQRRAWVLTRVFKGELTMIEAAALVGLSVRQVWRLRVAVERDGPSGLVHGNRGRVSPRRLDGSLRSRIVELRRTRYVDVNDTHFGELLAEREGIAVSREALRQILRADGIASPRRRRPPKHRSRRQRMPAAGLLLQLDGSRHDWLEGRGPWLTLVGAIDDATGIVPAATFRDQEDAAAYLEILRTTIEAEGLPGALYHDRHSAFAPTAPGAHEGNEPAPLSQLGRALVELGIGSIVARSAQAKGRIERLWGTFQDRLVVELRLAGIVDRAGANVVLASFLPRFNARFGVPPVDPEPAWRPLPDDVRLDRVLVFKYRRKVGRDHTIRLDGRILQLPPGRGNRGYAGRLVEVHVRLDGSMVAFDGDRELAVRAGPADAVQLRAQRRRQREPGPVLAPATLPWTPPADHPWRRVRPGTKLYQRLTESSGS
ncbi:MAG TPA: ISNCY family transposase [Candidatus Limnocylindrales bacterium]|nr:ISNCY family transposase [Candidatus Limnocylindrales bacterium]